MKRAVLYARVSGDDRQNSSSSLQSQLEMCRDYAQERGWTIVDELAEDDRGASGATWNLPQLDKVMEMAKAGEIDVVITRELDRLARNLAKQLVLEHEFSRSGVEVDYVIGNYEDTLEGRMTKNIRAVIAEYEREKIKERMVRGRRQKTRSGYVVLHGNCPYGYRAKKGEYGVKLVIDETMAEVVKMIFEWYVVTGWGCPTIARELNRMGISAPSTAKKTKTPRAIKWNQSQILRIIRNETYAGIWRYGKRNRDGRNPKDYQITVKVPAIISREVFEEAQRRRKKNRFLSKRNTKRNYLLARICFCGECQSPMVAYTRSWGDKDYSYYRCQVPHLQGTHYMNRQCSMKKNFRGDYWENEVWQEIRGFLANPQKLQKGINHYQEEQAAINKPLEKRLTVIEELVKGKQKMLDSLLDLYLLDEFDKDTLMERKHRLESTIASLQEEKNKLRALMKQTLNDAQITELQTISMEIAEGLSEADENFDVRRRILEYLGVQVFFSFEDDTETAIVKCQFAYRARLMIDKTRFSQNPSPQPESEQIASSREEGEDNYMSVDMHSMDCRRN